MSKSLGTVTSLTTLGTRRFPRYLISQSLKPLFDTVEYGSRGTLSHVITRHISSTSVTGMLTPIESTWKLL